MSSLNKCIGFEVPEIYVDTFGSGLGFHGSLGSHQRKGPLAKLQLKSKKSMKSLLLGGSQFH